ncbi:TPM domain-containing protein [Candidatus Nitrospira salsa]
MRSALYKKELLRRLFVIGVIIVWGSGLMLPMAFAQYPRPKVELNLPTPLGYVSDYAEVLSSHWSERIRGVCKEIEQRTGVEMIVVTLPTVGPELSVEKYASTLYEEWRIGTAQQQHGLLLLASIKERQAVVVLGRSLLSVITREQLNDLSAEFFVPMFKTHEFGKPLYQATVRLAAASGEVKFLEKPEKKSSNVGFWMNLSAALMMVYALWRFTRPEKTHPFQRWRRGEYWSTGQGGFGGNFGSFGGRLDE